MTIRRTIASALAVLAGVGVLVSAPTMAQAARPTETATESGRWAVGVYKERLIIPGLAYHYFTIEYTR